VSTGVLVKPRALPSGYPSNTGYIPTRVDILMFVRSHHPWRAQASVTSLSRSTLDDGTCGTQPRSAAGCARTPCPSRRRCSRCSAACGLNRTSRLPAGPCLFLTRTTGLSRLRASRFPCLLLALSTALSGAASTTQAGNLPVQAIGDSEHLQGPTAHLCDRCI